MATDNVKIAGKELKQVDLGVALENPSFSVYGNRKAYDGVMGFAKNKKFPTPAEALFKHGLTAHPITIFRLSRLTDGLNDGKITFGHLDPYSIDVKTLVTFKNVGEDGLWEGHFTAASVGGKRLELAGGRTAIFDTAFAGIGVPRGDIAAIAAGNPGWSTDNGDIIIPCTNTAVLSLTFNDVNFDTQPIDLLHAPVDIHKPKDKCTSSITETDAVPPGKWM